jgi:hypothetical protein
MKEIPNLTYINQLSKGNSSFEKTLLDIIRKELPKEIEAYQSYLINEDYTETALEVHKINHKIKILGLEKGCKIAEKYRLNLLEHSLILKSDFENILKSLLLFIKRV